MKRIFLPSVLVAVLMLGVPASGAWAAEEHGHHDVAASDGAQTLTGEVVDLVCYSSHPENGIGPGHAECAQKCIKSGLPVAIRSDGALYVALGAGHETANALLAPHGGKIVTVHGNVVERDGVKMIQVKSVEAN